MEPGPEAGKFTSDDGKGISQRGLAAMGEEIHSPGTNGVRREGLRGQSVRGFPRFVGLESAQCEGNGAASGANGGRHPTNQSHQQGEKDAEA
jgi:hypothetical protein